MNQFWAVGLLSTAAVVMPLGVAQAATLSYTTTLSGSNEVPANNSTAIGSATGFLEGGPTDWIFTYDVTFMGLAGPLQLAHIHVANMPDGLSPRQQTGPVVHDLDNPPLGETSGSFMGDWTSAEVAAASVDPAMVYERFLAGEYYFNLHSNTPEFLMPGEIRGQIEFDDVESVPEPASILGLLALGAGGAAAHFRKLKMAG